MDFQDFQWAVLPMDRYKSPCFLQNHGPHHLIFQLIGHVSKVTHSSRIAATRYTPRHALFGKMLAWPAKATMTV